MIMEKELNIAEILKDKPKGIKLWSDTFGVVELICITESDFPINLRSLNHCAVDLTKEGHYYNDVDDTLPCIVPSKSMQDWSKFAWKKGDVLFSNNTLVVFNRFVNDDYTDFEAAFEGYQNETYDEGNIFFTDDFSKATDDGAKDFIKNIEEHYGGKLNLETLEMEKPQFKDGDIVAYGNSVAICQKFDGYELSFYVADDDTLGLLYYSDVESRENFRLATDSEKQQLFDALEKEGKRWNSEIKTLEDLPKKCEFKPMDWCLMRDFGEKWKLCQFAFKEEELATDQAPYNAVGINWFLENLWHDASEEPKKDKLVLTDTRSIANKEHICWQAVKLTDNGFIRNWSNYVKATKITRWLYMEDLMKGGKK